MLLQDIGKIADREERSFQRHVFEALLPPFILYFAITLLMRWFVVPRLSWLWNAKTDGGIPWTGQTLQLPGALATPQGIAHVAALTLLLLMIFLLEMIVHNGLWHVLNYVVLGDPGIFQSSLRRAWRNWILYAALVAAVMFGVSEYLLYGSEHVTFSLVYLLFVGVWSARLVSDFASDQRRIIRMVAVVIIFSGSLILAQMTWWHASYPFVRALVLSLIVCGFVQSWVRFAEYLEYISKARPGTQNAAQFAARMIQQVAPEAEAGALRVLHVSDTHFTASSDYAEEAQSIGATVGRLLLPWRFWQKPAPIQSPQPLVDAQAFQQAFAPLAKNLPADVILFTGDMTDAGSRADWQRFFDSLGLDPESDGELARKLILVPGNHDINFIPSYVLIDTPESRAIRIARLLYYTLKFQGSRTFVLDGNDRPVPLAEFLDANDAAWLLPKLLGQLDGQLQQPILSALRQLVARTVHSFLNHRDDPASRLDEVWTRAFPMAVKIEASGKKYALIILNSIGQARHIAFNAYGWISQSEYERLRVLRAALRRDGYECFFATHHQVILPTTGLRLSINNLTDRFLRLEDAEDLLSHLHSGPPTVLFHGHRHIGYVAECIPFTAPSSYQAGHLTVVSAHSATLGNEASPGPDKRAILALDRFRVYTLQHGPDGSGIRCLGWRTWPAG